VLKLKESILTDFADVKLSVLFIAVGLAILALSLTAVKSLLLAQAAVTIMLAALIYLLLRWARRRKQYDTDTDDEVSDKPLFSPYVNQILDIAFWGLLIGAMFMLTQGVYARPLGFLLVVSVMVAILAVQIFRGKDTGRCILKIMVIGILLRASAYYQFPGIVGYDAVAEITYSEQLMATGYTSSFMEGYQYYPIAHLFTATTALVTGMGVTDSFFILGVAEVFGLIFIFLIGRHLFDTRIGLLAALIMAVFDWHILWGFYVKAMTFSIALLPMILFLVLTSLKSRKLPFLILSFLMMSLLILTHTFTTAILCVILAVAWFLFMMLRQISTDEVIEQPVTLNIVFLFVCATLAYWMYVSVFTNYIAHTIIFAFLLDTGGAVAFTLPLSTAENIWTKLPAFFFIFLATLGCLAIFNIRQLNRKRLSQVWIALLCGAMVIINFIVFYVPQFGLLIRERWFVFVGLIVAIPVAYGLVSITGRKGWRSTAVLFLLVFVFSGIMTTSYISNVASVIPWGAKSYLAATQSELTAAGTVSRITSPEEGEYIYADHYYSQIFFFNEGLSEGEVIDFSEIYQWELDEFGGVLVLRTAALNIVSAKEELVMDQVLF